jgi:hypothetical protein
MIGLPVLWIFLPCMDFARQSFVPFGDQRSLNARNIILFVDFFVNQIAEEDGNRAVRVIIGPYKPPRFADSSIHKCPMNCQHNTVNSTPGKARIGWQVTIQPMARLSPFS